MRFNILRLAESVRRMTVLVLPLPLVHRGMADNHHSALRMLVGSNNNEEKEKEEVVRVHWRRIRPLLAGTRKETLPGCHLGLGPNDRSPHGEAVKRKGCNDHTKDVRCVVWNDEAHEREGRVGMEEWRSVTTKKKDESENQQEV